MLVPTARMAAPLCEAPVARACIERQEDIVQEATGRKERRDGCSHVVSRARPEKAAQVHDAAQLVSHGVGQARPWMKPC